MIVDNKNILTILNAGVTSHGCTLLFAAESGSRAWGFPSADSDYDVRFIFAKPLKEYLKLTPGLTDLSIQDKHLNLDMAGWDLKKTIGLAEKSNQGLLDWLQSPLVYHDACYLRHSLRTILLKNFSPRALAHSHIGMLIGVRNKYLTRPDEGKAMKWYLYAVRSILCVMWLDQHDCQLPPIAITDLMAQPLNHELKGEIKKLLAAKLAAQQEKLPYKSQRLDETINFWCEKGHDLVNKLPARKVPTDQLEDLFREIVYGLDGVE